MIFFLKRLKDFSNSLVKSKLFNENTFYESFIKDLKRCKEEVIIESPYITCQRMKFFRPIFRRLIDHGLKVYVITRSPQEHDENLAEQAECEIQFFEELGVQVLLCEGNHHRKLAFLDRKILWEGSLNILSQGYSREIMRRFDSKRVANQMFKFLSLDKVI